MKAYNVGFISDEDLYLHVKNTVELYRKSIDLKQFNGNIIDPIKLTFDSKVYGKSFEQIIEGECLRQIDKSNTNHIGYFHQNIFKYVGQGWLVPEQGFDIVNERLHLYVELKNKHNTMSNGAATTVYANMQDKILHDDHAVCMLVEVIATKSKNENWNRNGWSHDKIRRVSIDQFYSLVFEDAQAFSKLCAVLPDVLEDVVDDMALGVVQNSVYQELKALSADTFKSLYLLAFRTYEGFDGF